MQNINKIIRIYKNLIRALECSELVSSVVEIAEKFNPEALKIESVVNMLKGHLPETDKLSVPARSHPLTIELRTLRQARDKILGALLSMLQSHNKATASSMTEAKKVVTPVLQKYLAKIHKDANFVKSRKIEVMFLELDGDSAKMEAAQTLGYTPLLDELKANQQSILAMQKMRRSTKALNPGIQSRKIVQNALTAMNDLFHTIEINQKALPEVDYTPLVNELNKMLAEYKVLLQARRTLALKSADIKKTDALSATTTASAGNKNISA